MSKVFEIELGGKVRRLTYDWNSARPFFKKRNRKPFRFLFVDCAGFVLDQHRRTMRGPDGNLLKDGELVDDDARFDLLALGLHMDDKQLGDLLSEFVAGGGDLPDIVWTAVKAAMYAGVTGKSIDLDEPPPAEEPAPEGKAQEAPEEPTTP